VAASEPFPELPKKARFADGELKSDGQRNYGSDVQNRLTSLTYPGSPGVQSSFTYDGLGRRFSTAVTSGGTSTTTYFVWCGAQICQTCNADGSLQRQFFPEGETIAATGTSLYYGPDQLGTPRVVTDQNNNQYFYEYDPLGKPDQLCRSNREAARGGTRRSRRGGNGRSCVGKRL
jgi:YD repeat-containing protein